MSGHCTALANLVKQTERPIAFTVRVVLKIGDLADIVSGYAGEDWSSVFVPDPLKDSPIYNTPTTNVTAGVPQVKIGALCSGSQQAMAVNGYNHSPEGMHAIAEWMKRGQPDSLRPQEMILFENIPRKKRARRVGDECYSMPWKKYGGPPKVGDVFYSVETSMRMSAHDSLLSMTRDSQSGRNQGSKEPCLIDLAPHAERLHVLLVHQLSPKVTLEMTSFQVKNYFRKEKLIVKCPQKLSHTVLSADTVKMDSISCLIYSRDNMYELGFFRILVVYTDVVTSSGTSSGTSTRTVKRRKLD
jgi:hypothetical protein